MKKKSNAGRKKGSGRFPGAIRCPMHPDKIEQVRRWGSERGAITLAESLRLVVDAGLSSGLKVGDK